MTVNTAIFSPISSKCQVKFISGGIEKGESESEEGSCLFLVLASGMRERERERFVGLVMNTLRRSILWEEEEKEEERIPGTMQRGSEWLGV